jgi:hypothetical protein
MSVNDLPLAVYDEENYAFRVPRPCSWPIPLYTNLGFSNRQVFGTF